MTAQSGVAALRLSDRLASDYVIAFARNSRSTWLESAASIPRSEIRNGRRPPGPGLAP
jgi:hypothetical protein